MSEHLNNIESALLGTGKYEFKRIQEQFIEYKDTGIFRKRANARLFVFDFKTKQMVEANEETKDWLLEFRLTEIENCLAVIVPQLNEVRFKVNEPIKVKGADIKSMITETGS